MKSIILWILVALLGAFAFATLALSQGETVNALWLIVAAVSTYAIA
jgi:carbon starvation protein